MIQRITVRGKTEEAWEEKGLCVLLCGTLTVFLAWWGNCKHWHTGSKKGTELMAFLILAHSKPILVFVLYRNLNNSFMVLPLQFPS